MNAACPQIQQLGDASNAGGLCDTGMRRTILVDEGHIRRSRSLREAGIILHSIDKEKGIA